MKLCWVLEEIDGETSWCRIFSKINRAIEIISEEMKSKGFLKKWEGISETGNFKIIDFQKDGIVSRWNFVMVEFED